MFFFKILRQSFISKHKETVEIFYFQSKRTELKVKQMLNLAVTNSKISVWILYRIYFFCFCFSEFSGPNLEVRVIRVYVIHEYLRHCYLFRFLTGCCSLYIYLYMYIYICICLVRLTWIVFVMGGRWPYSWCLVAGHCWRSRDELISDVPLWTPTYGRQKQDEQLEHTFSSYVRIRDVAWRPARGDER